MRWGQYTVAILAFYAVYILGSKARAYHSGARFQALACAESFSRGIFLGIALLHLLPEAYVDLHPFLGNATLYSVLIWALAALLFMLLCEKGITYLISITERKSHHWLAYWILWVLCLHALIEGFALGFSNDFMHFLMLAIAILVHKGSEGFALSTLLGRYHFTQMVQKYLLILLAFATPLGILLSGNLGFILQAQPFNLVEGYFNSIAAGTFLYIAICHALTGCDHAGHASAYKRWLYYGLGVALILLTRMVFKQ